MKSFLASLTLVIAIAALSTAAALASPPNLTGKWTIEQSGKNGTSSGTVTLTQTGNTLVGSNATNGNGFTGNFVSDTKMNGTWKGPGGAGWITVYATPNGHSFNGTWGYNGAKPNGTFVGNKVEPPAPITAAGSWNVTGVGSNQNFAGVMTCTQSGPTVVCQSNGVTLNGKYRTKDKVRATWRGPRGVGWFSYWFNDDSQSFNGQWGYGPDTTPPVGRVVGQRAPSTH